MIMPTDKGRVTVGLFNEPSPPAGRVSRQGRRREKTRRIRTLGTLSYQEGDETATMDEGSLDEGGWFLCNSALSRSRRPQVLHFPLFGLASLASDHPILDFHA